MFKKKLFILLLGFSLCFSGWQSVKASQQKSIEKAYYDLGYKYVSDAVQEAESYYKTKLNLPKKIPPLNFTHSFGRFIGEGDLNDGLEVEYLNEEKHINYIINVSPARYGMKLTSGTYSKIPLKDGTQAKYYTTGKGQKILAVFIIEKECWSYILSIQESLLDNPLPILVEIANSL